MKPKNKALQHLGFTAFAETPPAPLHQTKMKFAHNPFLRCCLTAALTFPMVVTAYADTALTTGQTIIDTTGNPALGVISRTTGATALFDNNGIATATGTTLVNGILGPWASIGTGTATRYATLDGSNNVVSFTGTATTWGGTVNSATANYEISAAGTATYGGSERLANTIRYTGSTGSTISLGNSSAFGLTVNGVITAGTGTITFNHGGGALAGAGIHIGASKELVLNAATAAINVTARVHNNAGGASAVTVVGPNTVTLSGTNTYTGNTTVNSGKLVVNGNSSTSVLTTVNNSGTLGGSGTIGALTVLSGGTVAPGNSPGILSAGNTDLQAGSTLSMEINGPAVGTGYDRLNVTGTVSLAGALSVSLGGYTPVNSALFFILANDGADAITGTFSNAPTDGATYTFDGQQFQISYFGDTTGGTFTGGNDVVLMAVPEPQAALLGSLGVLALLRRRRNR
jgi:fibronectin-binding autotransporter adhesin